MKGLLPNEFPFSRKRKTTTRRKTAKPTAAQKAVAAEATLSVVDATTAPAEPVATIESVLAEATPAVAAAVSVVAPAAADVVAVAPVVTPVAPAAVVAPVKPAAAVVAAKAEVPVAAIPVRVAGHATSRASVTPAALAIDATRVADARTADGYGGPERRRSPRQALRAKAIYRNDMNPAGAGPVQILNFSMGGVRLWSAKPLKTGERANVKMEIGPVKWSGRVKVVTCESHDDDGFAVGCEFAANEMSRRVA
jgi:hypothetical protein